MSLFGNLFGEKKKSTLNIELPWIVLNESLQLKELETQSYKTPVAIFKHSTRCGISQMVLRKFENEWNSEKNTEVALYFLDLIANRELSNEIAHRYDIRHESPQLLVLKSGKVVANASHQAINADLVT